MGFNRVSLNLPQLMALGFLHLANALHGRFDSRDRVTHGRTMIRARFLRGCFGVVSDFPQCRNSCEQRCRGARPFWYFSPRSSVYCSFDSGEIGLHLPLRLSRGCVILLSLVFVLAEISAQRWTIVPKNLLAITLTSPTYLYRISVCRG